MYKRQTKESVKVKIPGGIDTGMKLRVTGYGNVGGGKSGDLYVIIEVESHPIFNREGCHLLLDLPISFTEAALGAKKEIPTLEGPCKLTIPEGIQHGKVLRVKEKGLPELQGRGKGDLLVTIMIETPTHLTEEQKKQLEAFAALENERNLPHKESFLKKVKSFFAS